MSGSSSARGAATVARPAGKLDAQTSSELAALRELLEADPDAFEAAGLPTPAPTDHVTAVLISHDGARWLPETLAGLEAQTRAPDSVVAVDTGSSDASATLLRAALGDGAVIGAAARTGFGAAVAIAMAAQRTPPRQPPQPASDQPSWIWLLHDDCAPEPTALEELLRATMTLRNARLLGPKARDWDDPRLIVEVGLTVDRSGRRVTGLEPGEFDQGQHDGVRDVLAVPTAGALIRRDTWDVIGGLDPQLPLFRDDIDLGWRVTRAGHRVVVVPDAVVRHARAAATGRRHADAAPGIARRVDRRHALLVALANSSLLAVVLGLPRAVVASLLRAVGFLLTRRPHLAADEMAAVTTALRPGRLIKARRWRRTHAANLRSGGGARDGRPVVRSLLAPRGARTRAAIGVAGDWLTSGGGTPVAAAPESGPVSDDAEELLPADDIGRVRRFLTRPWLLLTLGTTGFSLIAERHLLSGGVLTGGRLLPSTLSARVLWRDYAASWHLGTLAGSPTPSPPWTPWLALAGSICGGRVGLAVGLILLLAVPLCVLAAYAASRPLGAGDQGFATTGRLWAALTYGFAPVATGAVAQGRFDVTVALIGLPLLARGCVGLVIGSRRRGAWRRAWSLGLGLATVAAFSPQIWPLAAAVLGFASLFRLFSGSPKAAVRLLVPLIATPALALPWLPRLAADPGVLLTGLGRPGGLAGQAASSTPHGTQLLALTPSAGSGYPAWWWLLPVLLLAFAGLISTQSRRRWAATVCWAVVLLALAAAVVTSRITVTGVNAGGSGGSAGMGGSGGMARAAALAGTAQHGWPGPALGLAAVGLLTAGLLATGDLRARLAAHTFGIRQLAAVVLVVIAVPVPVALAARWIGHGAGSPLARRDVGLLPPDVLTDAAGGGPGQRVLVLQRAGNGSVSWSLGRLDGPRLGDEEQVADPVAEQLVTTVVRDLATARGTDAAELLSTFDVHVIAVLGTRRTALTDALDTQPALSRRATGGYDLTLWQLTVPATRVELLDPMLAAAARHPAPISAGVGRGPSRSLLASDPPETVAAGPEGLVATVPRGAPGRLLVLSDGVDAGWRASISGLPLTPVTVWGWAQGFAIPAGGGQLRVVRDASDRHLLIILQAVALGLVLILAAPSLGRDRGRDDGVDGARQDQDLDDEDEASVQRLQQLQRLSKGRLA